MLEVEPMLPTLEKPNFLQYFPLWEKRPPDLSLSPENMETVVTNIIFYVSMIGRKFGNFALIEEIFLHDSYFQDI